MAKLQIGLISDTHGLLRPEAIELLRPCHAILHAGDIGSNDILKSLNAIAPTTAVRGNNDQEPWAKKIPASVRLEVGGVRIFLIHDIGQMTADPAREGIDAVVYGHSHQSDIKRKNEILFVNPGAAGPKRFDLPISVGFLDITRRTARARIVTLPE